MHLSSQPPYTRPLAPARPGAGAAGSEQALRGGAAAEGGAAAHAGGGAGGGGARGPGRGQKVAQLADGSPRLGPVHGCMQEAGFCQGRRGDGCAGG